MNLNLQDKAFVVTGGSRGIGRAIAAEFTAQGARVMICGRSEQSLASSANEIGCASVVSDVTTTDGQKALAGAIDSEFGGTIDGLVCNVGSGRSVPPGEETDAEWRRMFEVNLFSATATIENCLPHLRDGGTIGCISSIAGRTVIGAPVAYAAAKAALDSMIANLAPPLGARGIRIFGVAPGNTMFDGSVWERISNEEPERVDRMLKEDVPLRRFATAKEIANLVVYLSSSQAAFVSGSVHVIDGGQSHGG